jgi:hypothetical protein
MRLLHTADGKTCRQHTADVCSLFNDTFSVTQTDYTESNEKMIGK